MPDESANLRFEVPGPSDPRSDWDMTNWMVVGKWRHLVTRSGADEAVKRLIEGSELTDADRIAFGRLNFHAYIDGFGPPVALWDDSPQRPALTH